MFCSTQNELVEAVTTIAPPLALGHHAAGLLHAQEDARQIDVEHPLPAAIVDLEQRLDVGDAGVGDHRVEAPELLRAGAHGQRARPSRLLTSQVTARTGPAVVSSAAVVAGQVAVEVGDHDARTVGQEALGDRTADALRASGDDDCSGGGRAHRWSSTCPPSTGMITPVTHAAPGEIRLTTQCASSSAVAMRPSGT